MPQDFHGIHSHEEDLFMDSYTTIAPDSCATAELVDRKSRFIAQLKAISSEQEASSFLEAVRKEHYDARHHVCAWILASGEKRASDDGEPQRTAGMPILEVLEGAGLRDVCCIVTRYFGGTLLGPGGLIRAYSGAAKLAVEAAQAEGDLVNMRSITKVVTCIPYSAYDKVRRIAEDAHGKVEGSLFTDEVQLTLVFCTGDEHAFCSAMKEFANGEDLCVVHEPIFGPF